MEKQSRIQRAFLTFAFGGPAYYEGRTLRNAHQKLVTEKGLNDSHFDAILEHLASTLKELGVSDDLIKEAVAVAESVRSEVLCK